MKMNKYVAAAALATAALGVSAGTVNAAPAEENTAIDYSATIGETSATVRTDAGSLVVEDGVLEIKADNGDVLAGTPLSFRVDDFEFPIAASISDRTATLTPQFDVDHAVYKPVALPYEDQAPWKSDYDREVAAFNRLKDTISTGATIGTLVGGITGAGIGCILGGAASAALTGALSAMFGALPGAVVGCVAGMAAIGFLGTLIGQLFITAPVAIGAAIQYFSTVNEPHIQSK